MGGVGAGLGNAMSKSQEQDSSGGCRVGLGDEARRQEAPRALTQLTGPFIAVATGNLLDLEEMTKAPLSTVSANTTNADEALRPQALNNSGVVWVSVCVAW